MVIGRPSHQAETAYHHAVLFVVQGATTSHRPLRRQNAEVVAVIGRRYVALFAVPFRMGFLYVGRELRRWRLGCQPEKPVKFARRADQLARIFWYAILVAVLSSVVILSIDISLTGRDRIQFVRADPPREDFRFALRRIEIPGLAVLSKGIGNGK